MGLQRFPLGGFLGGMNLVDNPYALKSGEAQIAENVQLGFRNVLAVRGGLTPIAASPGGVDSEIYQMRPWYKGEDDRWLMINIGDEGTSKIFKLDQNEVLTEVYDGGEANPADQWCMEQMEYNPGAGFKDYMWFMNGGSAPQKWKGTGEFQAWGGKPPNGTMLRVWKNMMIVAGHEDYPQRIFFSDIANPESPEDDTNGGYANRWIDIRTSEDDLDPIKWIEVLDDVLLVFKKRSVNAIYDPVTFSFQRIANVGCEDRFQSCVVDDRCYFLNRQGIFSVTSSGAVRYESLNIEPIFTDPSSAYGFDLEALSHSPGIKCAMCSSRDGRIFFFVRSGSPTRQRLFEGYPRFRGLTDRNEPRTPWVAHTVKSLEFLANYRFADDEPDRLVCAQKLGGDIPRIHQLFVGLEDRDAEDEPEPFEFLWRSGFKSMISDEPFERIRRVNLTMKGACEARMIADGEEEPLFELESEGEGTKESLETFDPEARARFHALEISGEQKTPTQIFRGEFAIRGGKEH